MSPFEMFNRMCALRRREDVLVPVEPLRDLLLDVRNEQHEPEVVGMIDSHLRGTVRRSVFTHEEFDAIFHDIAQVLFDDPELHEEPDHAPLPHRRPWLARRHG